MSTTIKNIHEHLTYEIFDYKENEEDETISFLVNWDEKNQPLDKLMKKEYKNYLVDGKKSLLWVDQLKEIAEWKEGEELFINFKQNADGYFQVWVQRVNDCVPSMVIEKNGLVSIRTYNNYSWDETDEIKYSFLVRVDSLHNDQVCAVLRTREFISEFLTKFEITGDETNYVRESVIMEWLRSQWGKWELNRFRQAFKEYTSIEGKFKVTSRCMDIKGEWVVVWCGLTRKYLN
jgi:hypothetical protein